MKKIVDISNDVSVIQTDIIKKVYVNINYFGNSYIQPVTNMLSD